MIEDKQFVEVDTNTIRPQTVEDVLAEYRAYVRDPKAQLPSAILEELRLQGKIQ